MGIQYFKAEPTEYARLSVNGKPIGQGKGIAKLYFPFRTSIEILSLAANEHTFAFKEMTKEKQEATLQGGFTYRISDPEKVLERYNLSVNPKTRAYLKDDWSRIPDTLSQLVQSNAQRIVNDTPLEQLISMCDRLGRDVGTAVKDSDLTSRGIAVDHIYFSKISPAPDLARALEAPYREKVLQTADEATFTRRASAVEKERTIREKELQTSIELEQKREQLVTLEGKNRLQTAEFERDAQEEALSIYKEFTPELLRSLALYEIGRNAGKIGTLNVTPELLGLLQAR